MGGCEYGRKRCKYMDRIGMGVCVSKQSSSHVPSYPTVYVHACMQCTLDVCVRAHVTRFGRFEMKGGFEAAEPRPTHALYGPAYRARASSDQ